MWSSFGAVSYAAEMETRVQAIEDVLDDLGSGKPMDRLVCVVMWVSGKTRVIACGR
jgi:transcription-repair coupling factor (superfamily II helicase)